MKESQPKRYWWNFVGRSYDATIELIVDNMEIEDEEGIAANLTKSIQEPVKKELQKGNLNVDQQNMLSTVLAIEYDKNWKQKETQAKKTISHAESKYTKGALEHKTPEKHEPIIGKWREDWHLKEKQKKEKRKKVLVQDPEPPKWLKEINKDTKYEEPAKELNQIVVTASKEISTTIKECKELSGELGDEKPVKKIVTRIAKFFEDVGKFFKGTLKLSKVAKMFTNAATTIKKKSSQIVAAVQKIQVRQKAQNIGKALKEAPEKFRSVIRKKMQSRKFRGV